MKKLIKSKMYLIGTFTMACILFVSTGIQFWMTDYFVNVEKFDETAVHIAYAVVSITGPTSGCGFGNYSSNKGGFVISKKGGYENPKTVYYLFGFAMVVVGCAVSLPFTDNFYLVAA